MSFTQDMIHIADTKVARRYGDFFIRQIHKFEEVGCDTSTFVELEKSVFLMTKDIRNMFEYFNCFEYDIEMNDIKKILALHCISYEICSTVLMFSRLRLTFLFLLTAEQDTEEDAKQRQLFSIWERHKPMSVIWFSRWDSDIIGIEVFYVTWK